MFGHEDNETSADPAPSAGDGSGLEHAARPEADVLVEPRGGLLVVTLNRPGRLNAINEGLSRGLGEALHQANTDPAINAVLIAAAGRAFCAGMDLDSFLRGDPIAHPDHPEWGVAGIVQHHVRVPVVAAVHGVAAGGGFEIALCADIIVADATARFALPEVKLGLFAAAGGLLRLPRSMPPRIANELAYTGRFVDAEELARWGVVNQVTPAGAALEQAMAVATSIANGAPIATRATKTLLSGAYGNEDGAALHGRSDAGSAHHGGADGWAANARLMAEVFASDDAREGVAAFQDKRAPRWTGH